MKTPRRAQGLYPRGTLSRRVSLTARGRPAIHTSVSLAPLTTAGATETTTQGVGGMTGTAAEETTRGTGRAGETASDAVSPVSRGMHHATRDALMGAMAAGTLAAVMVVGARPSRLGWPRRQRFFSAPALQAGRRLVSSSRCRCRPRRWLLGVAAARRATPRLALLAGALRKASRRQFRLLCLPQPCYLHRHVPTEARPGLLQPRWLPQARSCSTSAHHSSSRRL